MTTQLEDRPPAAPRAGGEKQRGRRAAQYALTAVRGLVAVMFIMSGVPKVTGPEGFVAVFDRWGVPAPELFVPVLGVLEVIGGALLVLGLATRYVALMFTVVMVGAILTAGLVDGGGHLVVPPILGLLCVLLAVFGGGAGQLGRRRP